MRINLIVAFFLLISYLNFIANADDGTPARYSFRLNGKEINPQILSLNGSPDRPMPGDVVSLDDLMLMLVLGPEKNCDFIQYNEKPGILYLKSGNKEIPVAVTLDWFIHDKDDAIINPFKTLTKKEIFGLRGICLSGSADNIAESLKHANMNQVCITITDYAGLGKVPNIKCPPLPDNIKYLNFIARSYPGIADYSFLKSLKELRLLVMDYMSIDSFNIDLISQAKHLSYLKLSNKLLNISGLENLSEIRWLDLASCGGVSDIKFVRGLSQLQSLDISNTEVNDLTPIENLKQIRIVRANMSQAEHLPPVNIPSLELIELMSTKLNDKLVKQFTKANPQSDIRHRWREYLVNTIKDTNHLKIISYNETPFGTVLYEEKSKPEISNVINNIEIIEDKSNIQCKCGGDPIFQFYHNNILLAAVGYHHGERLRWKEGWPSDAMLSSKSQKYLTQWLSKHGITWPLKELTE